jgi:hypothetical protein
MAAEAIFMAANGVNPTTAALAPVTTGTAIKTLLQVATPSTMDLKVVSWGISFDGSAAATPIKCELIITDVAATVTSVTPSKWSDPNGKASLCVGGTSATGHTATAEGTVTATTELDLQLIAPTSQYVYEFSLGREPLVPVSKFLRIRVTAGAAVNAYCFVRWAE